LITSKVKKQQKNQHFSFDLFSKPQSDVYDYEGLRLHAAALTNTAIAEKASKNQV